MSWKRTLKEKSKIFLAGTLILAAIVSALINPKHNYWANRASVSLSINNTPLRLLTAHTAEEQRRGLMLTTTIGNFDGMIFIYSSTDHRSFWMYNTFIPLDIIFISADNKVVHINENTQPHQIAPLILSVQLAKYVIELPTSGPLHSVIKVGDYIEFSN